MDEETPYDRDVMISVLVYHQRRDITFCSCGWGALGRSHAEHVVEVYEQTMRNKYLRR